MKITDMTARSFVVRLILFFLIFAPFSLSAQVEMAINGELVLAPNDMDAAVYYKNKNKVVDVNDKVCALVKVKTTNPVSGILVLDTGAGMATVQMEKQANGDWWYWLSPDTKNISFSAEGYKQTQELGVRLKPGRVYKLNLTVGAAMKVVQEYSVENYFMKLDVQPKECENCVVSYGKDRNYNMGSGEVNEGYFEEELNKGLYYIKIESDFYETYTGEYKLDKSSKPKNISLKPAYGIIRVKSEPEGAYVYVDRDTVRYTTPFTSNKLKQGRHSIRVIKDDYYIYETTVDVKSNGKDVQEVPFIQLKPRFGTITCLCDDKEAELIVTDASGKTVGSGKTEMKIRLDSRGSYTLTAKKNNHYPQYTPIVMNTSMEGKSLSYSVNSPIPITGTLRVHAQPDDVKILIDNEMKGGPKWEGTLPIGQHRVKLVSKGYIPNEFTVTIQENKVTEQKKELNEIPIVLDMGLKKRWASRMSPNYNWEEKFVWTTPSPNDINELLNACYWEKRTRNEKTYWIGTCLSKPKQKIVVEDKEGRGNRPDWKLFQNWQIVDEEQTYNTKYFNKGFCHTIGVSYTLVLSRGTAIYRHSGYQEYGNLHPLVVDYTVGYKLHRVISMGVGVGFLYNINSLEIQGDEFSSMFSSFSEKRWDIPVFANIHLTPCRSVVRPVITASAGIYAMTSVLFWDAGAGIEFRLGKRPTMTLLVSARQVPWPVFDESAEKAYYQGAIAPSFRLCFGF